MCEIPLLSLEVLLLEFLLIDASVLYQPIHAIKWKTDNLTHKRFFCDNDDLKKVREKLKILKGKLTAASMWMMKYVHTIHHPLMRPT